jgi:hypothetical protein
MWFFFVFTYHVFELVWYLKMLEDFKSTIHDTTIDITKYDKT